MNNNAGEQINHKDIFPDRLLNSRVYKEVTQRTIETAFKSYKTARCLSIVSYIIGITLLLLAVIFAIVCNDKAWLSAVFGAFGTLNIVGLLITRPIERIQHGVNDLLRAQIACLTFAASYESIVRYLITASELPFGDKNRDLLKEFERAKYLMESSLQFVGIQSLTQDQNK
jgi:hypothetical protein